jgi:hypothetical protein
MNEIKNGDIFTANQNKFMCADIEKEECCKIMNLPEKIYMVYTDPPWNSGNARMWRTKAKVDGEEGRKVDWHNFVDRLCEHVLYPSPEHIFIEMGVKQTDNFIEQAIGNGFPQLRNIWRVFYNYTHPNNLLYFSKINEFLGDPAGMKNESMTEYVFEHIAKRGEIVFDPCIGLGMTARMAHKFGMICYGIELNPMRLQKTIMWFSQQKYKIMRLKDG